MVHVAMPHRFVWGAGDGLQRAFFVSHFFDAFNGNLTVTDKWLQLSLCVIPALSTNVLDSFSQLHASQAARRAAIGIIAAGPAMAVAPDHNQRSTLESFTIRGKLGAGAFAVVYKAVRHADGRTYALKELDLRGLSSTQQQDAIQETSVLASLDCPHIIKFHDSFLHEVRGGDERCLA